MSRKRAGPREMRSSALWGNGGRGGEPLERALGQGRPRHARCIVAVCRAGGSARGDRALCGSSNGDGEPAGTDARTEPQRVRRSLERHSRRSTLTFKVIDPEPGSLDVIVAEHRRHRRREHGGEAARQGRAAGRHRSTTRQRQVQLVDGIARRRCRRSRSRSCRRSRASSTITPDARSRSRASTKPASTQLWPYESGNATVLAGRLVHGARRLPAIAIVDSGIQNRADFGNRLIGERQPVDAVHAATRPATVAVTARSSRASRRARRRPRRCRAGRAARLARGDGRPGHGEDVRRDRGVPVDPGQQEQVQHPASRTSRCTRATARTSTATRSTRRSRSCGSTASSSSRRPATTARRTARRACSTHRATTRS